MTETGKDTLQKQWEGRSEFEMEPNSEQRLVNTITSPNGALLKQRRNQLPRGGTSASPRHVLLPPFEQVALYGNIKKSQRQATTNAWRISPVLQCVHATSSWEDQMQFTGSIKGKQTYLQVCVYEYLRLQSWCGDVRPWWMGSQRAT